MMMNLFPGLSLRSNPGLKLANAFGVSIPMFNSNGTSTGFFVSSCKVLSFCHNHLYLLIGWPDAPNIGETPAKE
jgi:hypothetical protein